MRRILQNALKEGAKKNVERGWNVAIYVKRFVICMIAIKINVLNLAPELIKIVD
jgi:hypothetical protein